jgi:hypothetical protein
LRRSARRALGLLAGALSAAGLAAPTTASAVETCPNAAFRTGPSEHLPDCRAYEMVTPDSKNGAQPFFAATSPSGNRVAINAFGTLTPTTGDKTGVFSSYFDERTPEGWKLRSVDPPSGIFADPFRPGFSEIGGQYMNGYELESGRAVYVTRARALYQEQQLYAEAPSGVFQRFGPVGAPGFEKLVEEERNFGIPYAPVAISKDFSHLVYATERSYWPELGTGKVAQLYEYTGLEQSHPLLVGVDNQGKPIGKCGVQLGGGEAERTFFEYPVTRDAMSADGSKIFFTPQVPPGQRNKPCAEGGPAREVYARVDNGTSSAHTCRGYAHHDCGVLAAHLVADHADLGRAAFDRYRGARVHDPAVLGGEGGGHRQFGGAQVTIRRQRRVRPRRQSQFEGADRHIGHGVEGRGGHAFF